MLELLFLEKDELMELIIAYDEYIQNTNDEDLYSEGWKPVCIEEFYMNEFREV